MPRWIFFDIGSVLFEDTRQAFRMYESLAERLAEIDPDVTFTEILAERERRVSAGESYVVHKIANERLGPERAENLFTELRAELHKRFDHNHRPMPGAEAALARLSDRYRLGVLANQPEEARWSLHRRGWLPAFDVVAISDEVGLHKPDPDLYRWAIKHAGCRPNDAAMIGDRIDNDVVPAATVGMKTVLFSIPDEIRLGESRTDRENEFLESCRRVPVFDTAERRGRTPPDLTVNGFETLVDSIDDLWAG